MKATTRTALRLGSIAALALALSACGGEDPAPRSEASGFSLFDPIGADQWPGGIPDASQPLLPAFSEDEYFGGALPRAAPMTRAVSSGGYGYAPDYYADYPADEPVYYDDSPSDNSYAWLSLASALGGVIGDSPPDYYFDYDDGVEPWAWETGDHFVRYAEPLDDGYRYYYYSPGEAHPFLVRDPDYSYGYYNNRVAVIYDRGGRVLDSRRSWRQRQAGQQYYARARDLREASRLRPRRGVAAPLWNERRTVIAREQRQWDDARVQRAGWQGWDRRNERAVAPRWTGERVARQQAAQRFETWRGDGFRGQAPRLYRDGERSARVRQALQQGEQPRGIAGRSAFREQPRIDGQRLVNVQRGRDEERAQAFRAQRDARVERARIRPQPAQDVRPQRLQARQEYRAQRSQVQQQGRAERAQAVSQGRKEARIRRVEAAQGRQPRIERARVTQARQEARVQRSQAMSQAREQARAQRSPAMSQARQEARVQRAQAQRSQTLRSQVMSQAREQRATMRQSQAKAQPRQDFRAQRQEARAQRQQGQVQQAQGNRGVAREARVAERQQRGGDRRMN